jgi:hypothetical protein
MTSCEVAIRPFDGDTTAFFNAEMTITINQIRWFTSSPQSRSARGLLFVLYGRRLGCFFLDDEEEDCQDGIDLHQE